MNTYIIWAEYHDNTISFYFFITSSGGLILEIFRNTDELDYGWKEPSSVVIKCKENGP